MLRVLCGLILFAVSQNLAAVGSPVGHYNHGELKQAVNIQKVIMNTKGKLASVSPQQFQYGSHALADALEKIAHWVHQNKMQPIKVGDTAKKSGGKIARHTTHQSGLDADIGYLAFAPKKSGHRFRSFHNRFTEKFELKGKVTANIDMKNNLKLFRHLSEKVAVSRILVGCQLVQKFAQLDAEDGGQLKNLVKGWPGHEDHFHLRLKCPQGEEGCTEKWWKDPAKKRKKKSKVKRGC